MGFRRLFGLENNGRDQEPPEIDTQITTVALLPGHTVEGIVLLRGGSQGFKVDHLNLDVVAKGYYYNGTLNDDEVTGLSPRRHSLSVAPGAEVQVPFSGRLPWECPVTELGGRALGVDVSLTTRLQWESESPVRDLDFLHIAAPPLYEAVLDAFAQEGYHVDGSQLLDEYIPDAEARRGLYQVFFVSDPTRGTDRFAELEVVFLQNVIGAMVYVRRAARSSFQWSEKPPVRSFPAAHHEVGQADLGERVRSALAALALLDG
ncbi:sporulation protein [Streptomyces sp. SP18CS02]|uniref:sporulation protein n=1 Tax=Streptomyces sp. SP18CS02 TaxID=3002531 RepID=UPI002E780E69|nr:sporulation protein [Streptomyces sp. SP18CS02]MEE1755269.1 sporulation protein [Streptomyces sp. SP18CS02]